MATKVKGPASSVRVRNASTCSSSSAAITDTWDLDRRGMQIVRRVSLSARSTPPAGSRSLPRSLGLFGPAPAFHQPVREVGAGPQLGNRDVDRAGTGVEVAVVVAVAGVRTVRARLAIGGAADRVAFRAHQRVDERGQQLVQQVRRRSRRTCCTDK